MATCPAGADPADEAVQSVVFTVQTKAANGAMVVKLALQRLGVVPGPLLTRPLAFTLACPADRT